MVGHLDMSIVSGRNKNGIDRWKEYVVRLLITKNDTVTVFRIRKNIEKIAELRVREMSISLKLAKKKLGKIVLLMVPMLLLACCGPRQNNSSDISQNNSEAWNVSDILTSEGAAYSDLISDHKTSDSEQISGSSKTASTKSQTQTATSSAEGSSENLASSGKFGVEGDTSFRIDVSGLQKNTVYSVTKDALLSSGKIMGHDILRLFVSLQGLINRDLKLNHIALIIEPYQSSDTFWINYMEKSGAPLENMKKVKITSFQSFLDTFQNQLKSCGMILWDPDVPSTANAAATICGLDGYLPVKYDEESSGLQAKLSQMGVPVKMNLRKRFTGKGIIYGTKTASTGSAKCDVYLWMMEKYMDRCSTKYMVYAADGASCVSDNIIYQQDTDSRDAFGAVNLVSHDYGIARRAFFFDLSPVSTEAPCDDLNQKVGTDVKTMKKLFQKRYDRAGGEFGCMIGFPPWQLKYTKHNNWGSVADTTVEALFVQICTMYNMYLDASFSQSNSSVYYHYPLKSSYKNGNKTVTEKFDSKTIYIYYHLGDYDASAWATNYLWAAYQDSDRGKLPLTWAVNPGLSDRIPMLFDYMYSNLSENDTICASDSGIGYISPQYLFQDDRLADGRTLPNGDQKLISVSKPYFQKFDMDIVSFIISKMSNDCYATYQSFAPNGSFHYDRSKPITIYKGTPYVPTKNGVGDPGNYLESAKGMYEYLITTMEGTNFLATRTICWKPSELILLTEAFEDYASQYMPGYIFKVVNAYTFMEMVKQSGQATVIS